MAGITRCLHEECPEKDNCFRFKASPEENTSNASFQYICNEKNGYKHFWHIEPTALEKAEAEVINS